MRLIREELERVVVEHSATVTFSDTLSEYWLPNFYHLDEVLPPIMTLVFGGGSIAVFKFIREGRLLLEKYLEIKKNQKIVIINNGLRVELHAGADIPAAAEAFLVASQKSEHTEFSSSSKPAAPSKPRKQREQRQQKS